MNVVQRFGTRRPTAEKLPEVGTIPGYPRKEPPMQTEGDPLSELGKLADDARKGNLAIVHTDDAGPVEVDLTLPPARDARIAELIDKTLATYATDMRATAHGVMEAFEKLSGDAAVHAAEARTLIEGAGSAAKNVIEECLHAGEFLATTGTRMREQHREFMTTTRNAMVAVLNVKSALRQAGAGPTLGDQEVAIEQARELLGKLERVTPAAPFVGQLRGLLDSPATSEMPHEEKAEAD